MPVMNVRGKKFDVSQDYCKTCTFKPLLEPVGDSETMPNNICSSCLNAGVPCTHNKEQQNTLKKRGLKPGAIQAVPSQPVHILVANILKGTPFEPFSIPEDKEAIRKILVKLASRIQELEKDQKFAAYDNWIEGLRDEFTSSNATFLPSGQVPNAPEPSQPVEDSEAVENLSKELAQFSFGPPKETHFGESSNIMLMKVALDHRKQLSGLNLPDWNSVFAHVRRPEFWGTNRYWYPIAPPQPKASMYDFPPVNDLHRFIDIYFLERESYMPLLHRPTFEKSIRQGLHHRDPSFGAVVLAICAHGEKLYSTSSLEDNPGYRWINQIHLDGFVFQETLALEHLQVYCLMIWYLNSISKGINNVWLLTGIAIRRAQEKGAHRRYFTSSTQPTIEGELWKRAFWNLMIIDMMISAFFGRPRAISNQDFDADHLIECDDEYWEPEDGSQRFVQPAGKPSKISYWNAYLRLMEIFGFALLTIYSVRKSELGNKMGIGNIEWYEKAVMGIDSALNQWLGSMPEHLLWEKQNPDPIFFTQSTLLYSWYYWIQISVHRRFIPRPMDGSGILSFPSLAICTNAARSCLRVCEAYVKRESRYYSQLTIVIFNSATVLALNLIRSTKLKVRFDARKEMMDIHKCIELLRLFETTSRFAGRLTDVLNVMMYTSHLPTQSENAAGSSAVSCEGSSAASTTAQHPPQAQTFHPQPSAPNQPLHQFTSTNGDWGNATPAALPPSAFTTSLSTSNPTTLPFYSSELGGLPIHPSFSSFNNEPIGDFSEFSYPQAPAEANAALSPDVRQYSSLFDDGMGNNSGAGQNSSFMTASSGAFVLVISRFLFLEMKLTLDLPFSLSDPVPDMSQQNYSSVSQDWDTFMASVDKLLDTSAETTSFDPFSF
ncbi:hypothetical protein D9758_013447 [Tetrapyrgos nigripes]|uniref:Xylanolytic transcriptional activator regulatory domain-containing protein n=1 Tax=Tetrapyrgos nigripes TaxID=182062 RepID=A0A8H5FRZ8_9AGAR|nr:hypothetical protein D9758_013447 [Tetrapyrgos nigripes]